MTWPRYLSDLLACPPDKLIVERRSGGQIEALGFKPIVRVNAEYRSEARARPRTSAELSARLLALEDLLRLEPGELAQ